MRDARLPLILGILLVAPLGLMIARPDGAARAGVRDATEP